MLCSWWFLLPRADGRKSASGHVKCLAKENPFCRVLLAQLACLALVFQWPKFNSSLSHCRLCLLQRHHSANQPYHLLLFRLRLYRYIVGLFLLGRFTLGVGCSTPESGPCTSVSTTKGEIVSEACEISSGMHRQLADTDADLV